MLSQLFYRRSFFPLPIEALHNDIAELVWLRKALQFRPCLLGLRFYKVKRLFSRQDET